MPEIKTIPLPATYVQEKEVFRAGKAPGSFRVDQPDDDGEQDFWYCCPCGCGSIAAINVGMGFKPSFSPSWNWNGSFDKPTLSPSVHHRGHWHGWLQDGIWRSC